MITLLSRARLATIVAAGLLAGFAGFVFALSAEAQEFVLGQRSEEIRIVQVALNATPCTVATAGPGSSGEETTYFGSLTQSALICYQLREGLSITGTITQETYRALHRIYLQQRVLALLRSRGESPLAFFTRNGINPADLGFRHSDLLLSQVAASIEVVPIDLRIFTGTLPQNVSGGYKIAGSTVRAVKRGITHYRYKVASVGGDDTPGSTLYSRCVFDGSEGSAWIPVADSFDIDTTGTVQVPDPLLICVQGRSGENGPVEQKVVGMRIRAVPLATSGPPWLLDEEYTWEFEYSLPAVEVVPEPEEDPEDERPSGEEVKEVVPIDLRVRPSSTGTLPEASGYRVNLNIIAVKRSITHYRYKVESVGNDGTPGPDLYSRCIFDGNEGSAWISVTNDFSIDTTGTIQIPNPLLVCVQGRSGASGALEQKVAGVRIRAIPYEPSPTDSWILDEEYTWEFEHPLSVVDPVPERPDDRQPSSEPIIRINQGRSISIRRLQYSVREIKVEADRNSGITHFRYAVAPGDSSRSCAFISDEDWGDWNEMEERDGKLRDVSVLGFDTDWIDGVPNGVVICVQGRVGESGSPLQTVSGLYVKACRGEDRNGNAYWSACSTGRDFEGESIAKSGSQFACGGRIPGSNVVSTSFYTDSALSNKINFYSRPSRPYAYRKAGDVIYTKVTFSDDVIHNKANTAAARPKIFSHIGLLRPTGGKTEVQYDILDYDDTLQHGDCKPTHASNTNVYICMYTVPSDVTDSFTVRVAAGTMCREETGSEDDYIQGNTILLDNTPPADLRVIGITGVTGRERDIRVRVSLDRGNPNIADQVHLVFGGSCRTFGSDGNGVSSPLSVPAGFEEDREHAIVVPAIEGSYSDCTVRAVDGAGNESGAPVPLPEFSVGERRSSGGGGGGGRGNAPRAQSQQASSQLPGLFLPGEDDNKNRIVQVMLNRTSCPVALSGPGSLGNEVSYFGQITQDALICYQKKKGLPATGLLDERTFYLLQISYIRSLIVSYFDQRDLDFADYGLDREDFTE